MSRMGSERVRVENGRASLRGLSAITGSRFDFGGRECDDIFWRGGRGLIETIHFASLHY